MGLWIVVAAACGFISVAMGAFAAHGLEGRLDPKALDWIETAARYQAIHALALLGVAILGVAILGGRTAVTLGSLRLAAWAFTAGMVLFSGSLYAMGLFGWRGLGAVVPFGGLAFLVGWALLGIFGWRTQGRIRSAD